MTKKLKEEILNLLNDAYYWKESTSEHKKRINAVYEQLTIPFVGCSSTDKEKQNLQEEKEALHIGVVRRSALDWFNRLTLEEQFYKTIEHNALIAGDNTRHPNTLTGREIETIYLADA